MNSAKERAVAACEAARDAWRRDLDSPAAGRAAGAAAAYLDARGLGADVRARWGIGYAPGGASLVDELLRQGFTAEELLAADLARERSGRLADRYFDRAMFPIEDEEGRTIAFGGRIIGAAKREGVPKYVNTRDTNAFSKKKHLFAYARAKEEIRRSSQAIVCEGYTDVIAMHEHGLTGAVAALGTAFGPDHIALLDRLGTRRVVCLFDGDAAGQRAAEHALALAPLSGAELACVTLPGGQDPAEYLADHPADELRALIAQARPLVEWVCEKRVCSAMRKSPGAAEIEFRKLQAELAPYRYSSMRDALEEAVRRGSGGRIETPLFEQAEPGREDLRAPGRDDPPPRGGDGEWDR